MLLRLSLTSLIAHMTSGRIECVHGAPGTSIMPGTRLFDVSVDLGSAFAQECPPISYYRIVARERAVLRSLAVAPGDLIDVGGTLALFSTDVDDDVSAPPARDIRVATASIIYHDAMWSGAH